jgi:DNA-binding NarL/FixJ family response regulator
MGRQNQTNPDDHDWALSPQQEAAVALLSVGRTVTETAAELGVARQTVSEWANQHLGFRWH